MNRTKGNIFLKKESSGCFPNMPLTRFFGTAKSHKVSIGYSHFPFHILSAQENCGDFPPLSLFEWASKQEFHRSEAIEIASLLDLYIKQYGTN